MFKRYKRKQISELMEWSPDVDMSRVSVSQSDIENGSPKEGDMIARNPKNHEDKWLVARRYFMANFEEIGTVSNSDSKAWSSDDEWIWNDA